MGYDFSMQDADISRTGSKVNLRLSLINQGVAPFYYDWKIEVGTIVKGGTIARRWPMDWKLTGLLPKDPPRIWETDIDDADFAAQRYTLAVRVINPMPGGKALRFANADQNRDADGWLSVSGH